MNSIWFQSRCGLVSMALLALIGVSLAGCSSKPLNNEQATRFFADWGKAVRWVGYQGSDQQYHYFIARVMDSWRFIQIEKSKLTVAEEWPNSKASSAPLYHYIVDPHNNYKKIEPTGSS